MSILSDIFNSDEVETFPLSPSGPLLDPGGLFNPNDVDFSNPFKNPYAPAGTVHDPLGIFGFFFPDKDAQGGIGGDLPGNASGNVSKQFQSVTDRGFAQTSTNPQNMIPILIGTTMVYGTLVDYVLLGENDVVMFAVIGISQSSITKVNIFIDNKNIVGLPQYIDVDGGDTLDNTKTWLQFFGNGGDSGDIPIVNSGKKNFGTVARVGQVAVTPKVNIIKTISGKNEVRVFVSIDAPGLVKDQLDTVDAVYTGLVGEVLRIRAAHGAVLDATGFYTDITFTAGATDATGTALDINTLAGAYFTASVINGDELRIVSDHATLKWMLIPPNEPTTGRANDLLKFEVSNFGTTFDYRLSYQKQGESSDTEISAGCCCCPNPLEGRAFPGSVPSTLSGGTLLFDNESRGCATSNGTTTTIIDSAQKWTQDEVAIGDVINFTSGANIGETSVLTGIDTDNDELTFSPAIAGATVIDECYEVITDNYYFGVDLPEAGDYNFILEIDSATNGASFAIATVEVMSDFIETSSPDYSSLTGKTLEAKINGTVRTVTFSGAAVDAATTATEIQAQWDKYVTATPDIDENIEVEVLAEPIGSNVQAEEKQFKITGGTASEQLNFLPIFQDIRSYDLPGTAYAVGHIKKTSAISGNPRFSFDVTGSVSNPAQALLELFQEPEFLLSYGLDLGTEIDLESFEESISFCDNENLTANIALLDISYGQAVQLLLQAGSLLLPKPAGRIKLIPEKDSESVATLNQTDDIKEDNIISGSFRWNLLEETLKFNVLRVIFPDSTNKYINKNIIIDVTGLVDTQNGQEPQIVEGGELIDIVNSTKDFRRERAVNMPAVTTEAQALKLGNQIFRKANKRNFGFSMGVSIIHYYLEQYDIVALNIDKYGFREKKCRIMSIKENSSGGFNLSLLEHFPEIYN